MENIEINIHGFRFIEIETGYVAKPNRTAINRVPLSALIWAHPSGKITCKIKFICLSGGLYPVFNQNRITNTYWRPMTMTY